MQYWKECGKFLRECRRQFRSTGAVLPSTRFLARALVSELRKAREPGRILEVGPGTGSVTKEILRHLKAADRLDLVEINPRFLTLLQERFDREWEFRFYREQVKLICSAVEAMPGEGLYDFIV
ncbi:MAG TPA: SAM-dependent methyltransferase, partial [Gemmataceae bacterium]|nr:SAM-dependent methyltransferase [Gemmataceae bacterium]